VPPFWLSHHHQEEWGRTYRVAGVRLCARCIGTYPAMFVAIALQLARNAPLAWAYDGAWSVLLLLPALADWARGRFRPASGSNALRTATGVLLGLALGRTLYVHLRHPFPAWLLVQAALVTAVAAPVILASYRRRGRT